MRFALAMVCVLTSVPGWVHAAERLDDFACTLPSAVDAQEGLHQLELNGLVHQGVMRSDFGDIRVFNGAGEPVPHAFAPPPRDAPAAPTETALPFFPIRAERDARIDALDLKVETRADGTVVGLTTQPKTAPAASRHVGYLLDASAIATPLSALRLEWKRAANGTHTRVRLEASDDLAHRDAQRPGYAIANLVPGYQAGEPLDLPSARLGEPSRGDQPLPAPPAEPPDYRKWTLWAVLLLAVAVLTLMAHRLVRQLGRDAGGSAATERGEERRRRSN